MRFRFLGLAPKLKSNLRRYVFQVMVAAAALLLILWLENPLTGAALIAAIGSTAFVLFMTPESRSAAPRHVVGGHLIGLVAGSVAGSFGADTGQAFLFALQAASAVGVTMFFMAATDTEHAPAAGTALGMAVHGFSWGLATFVVSAVVAMAVIHRLLRPWLRDLS